MSSSLSPTETNTAHLVDLAEAGDQMTWISYSVGIIIGVLLAEMAFVLFIVICRRRQMRKENLLKQHIYYTVGQERQTNLSDRQTNATQDGSGDNPPSSLSAPAAVTLTHYVNVQPEGEEEEVVGVETWPIDIPSGTDNPTSRRNGSRSDVVTNSAYSAGIHYACIPGEAPSTTGIDLDAEMMASEHVYSEIKDGTKSKEVTRNVKLLATNDEVQATRNEDLQETKRILERPSYENDEIRRRNEAISLAATNRNNQPVEIESDEFMELMPRNLEAYDILKRNEHQELPGLSMLISSGPYLEQGEFLTDLASPQFNPYGHLSDDYQVDNELLPEMETEFNPYDDIVGVSSQIPSLQISANCSAAVSNSDVTSSRGLLNKPPPSSPPASWEAVDKEREMVHAYDAIDELQKQINILSQSIPTLDCYGYEDLDKIKPVPKASQSIPALDVAGYEDLDAVKPKQASVTTTHHHKKQLERTQDVNFHLHAHFYEDVPERRKERHSLGAVMDTTEEFPPSIPPRTIESLYTAVQKKSRSSTVTKQAVAAPGFGEVDMLLTERHMTARGRPKKSSSTNDLLSENSQPASPHTVGALYTKVQKPKKKSSATFNMGEEPPQIPPKSDIQNPPVVGVTYSTVNKPKKKSSASIKDMDEEPPQFPPKCEGTPQIPPKFEKKTSSSSLTPNPARLSYITVELGKAEGPPGISDIISPLSIPSNSEKVFYSTVQKPKNSSTLRSGNTEGPPQIPPKSDIKSSPSTGISDIISPLSIPSNSEKVFYSTVQKPKNSSTLRSGNTEGPPQIPPKSDIKSSPPTIPPKTPDIEMAHSGKELPPPIPPKGVEGYYLATQKEGEIPPIPYRTAQRVYSGVYRHKEDRVTNL